MSIQANVIIVSDGDTLAHVRAFVAQCKRLGIDARGVLHDGDWLAIDGEEPLWSTHGETLEDAYAWVDAHQDTPADTYVDGARELSMLARSSIGEEISCSEHIGSEPSNILITIHPACHAHTEIHSEVRESASA